MICSRKLLKPTPQNIPTAANHISRPTSPQGSFRLHPYRVFQETVLGLHIESVGFFDDAMLKFRFRIRTLSLGATLRMLPRAELLNEIRRAVSGLKPTMASLTPSVAQLLDPSPAQLHILILSGEVVPSKTRDRFIRAETTLINGYGPTESNIV
jgi:hypothetical protein